ncbi:MAG: hypothetical protein V7607_6144 [Solirubrobacteraceae bacterium]
MPTANLVRRGRRRGSAFSDRLASEIVAYDDVLSARVEPPPFHYPAMMVSPMQGVLLDAVVEIRGGHGHVLDPFLGSATTLAEAASRGLPFTGLDINPLAVLLGHVESAEAAGLGVDASVHDVVARARRWQGTLTAPDQPWCRKWFRPDVAAGLTSLRASIAEQPDVRERRLLWAALSEVVRLSGHHRARAPKLQTRPLATLGRALDVIGAFETGALRLAQQMEQRHDRYRRAGWYVRCGGRPDLRLSCGDVRGLRPSDRLADIVLTSPPYGDNHTTMPYGQVSYLPLRWIDLHDIDRAIDPQLLAASKSLDTASLGGSLRVDAAALAALRDRSATLSDLVGRLRDAPPQGLKRTASFFVDLDAGLRRIALAAAPDAHMVMTVGDKTTYGRHVPTTQIVCELLDTYDFRTVEQLGRRIGRAKRLAPRNEFGATIGTETVIVAERG